MTEAAARIVVWSILTVALVVWMFAVRYVARVRKAERQTKETERLVFEPEDTAANQLVGQVPVDAGPLGLSETLSRALAQPQVSQLGAIKVKRMDAESVSFEQIERDRTSGLRIDDGEVRFVAAGHNRSMAQYRMAIEHGRGRLFAAQVLLGGGLAAIAGVWLVMETYVIPSASPQLRWQSFQSLQVAHLLWPPFQLAALHRASRTAAVARIEALLANLPYLP
jgi:hypothetical protein